MNNKPEKHIAAMNMKKIKSEIIPCRALYWVMLVLKKYTNVSLTI